jgi:hypothetical protein
VCIRQGPNYKKETIQVLKTKNLMRGTDCSNWVTEEIGNAIANSNPGLTTARSHPSPPAEGSLRRQMSPRPRRDKKNPNSFYPSSKLPLVPPICQTQLENKLSC